MHSNMFIGVGKLSYINIEDGKAWIATDWGSVAISWPSDNPNFAQGFDELQEDDTIHIMGRVWMYNNRSADVSDATVIVHTLEALKPAQRAKKANKHFARVTKEVDDAVRFGNTYKSYWIKEREKCNAETALRRAAQEAQRTAEDKLALSQDAFREALMTEMVGGDNTDERP